MQNATYNSASNKSLVAVGYGSEHATFKETLAPTRGLDQAKDGVRQAASN